MIGGVEITTQDATMQTATDRMIDDAVAMYENFVSRAMDPIGVFGITIVEGQVLPAAEGASSRQAHAIDNGEIDKSAAPDDAVTIDMILIRTEPGRPWPARGEEPPAQHLPKLNQVVRGAHDPNAPGFSAAGFSQSDQKFKNVDSRHAVGIENPYPVVSVRKGVFEPGFHRPTGTQVQPMSNHRDDLGVGPLRRPVRRAPSP